MKDMDRYFRNESILEEAILSLHEPIRRDDGKIEGYGECILNGIKLIELGESWIIEGHHGCQSTLEIEFDDGSTKTFVALGDDS